MLEFKNFHNSLENAGTDNVSITGEFNVKSKLIVLIIMRSWKIRYTLYICMMDGDIQV